MVAAQNSDIQRVWRLVQELSSQLKANQQETERLRRYVEINPSGLEHSGLENGTNGRTSGSDVRASKQATSDELSSIRHAYAISLDENIGLREQVEDLSRLCAEYEMGMTRTIDQVREHEHEIMASTIALHRNYASQLETERETNDALRNEAVEMQANLHRLSGLVRNALSEYSDVEAESIVQALAIENESLRSQLLSETTTIVDESHARADSA